MTPSPVRVREIPSGDSLEPFIDLAWKINAADPNWVPPLRMQVSAVLNRAKHPFHQHADVAYCVAERAGEIVGRVAAIVNHAHNRYHEDRVGFFGLFECEENPETARALLDRAADWLRERGMERMRGPVNLSTNEELASPGVLIDGFHTPPMIQMTHNPPYYPVLLDAAGLVKSKDVVAYWFGDNAVPERLARGFDRVLERSGTTIRPLNMKKFRQEVDVIKGIYNAAWSRNWGFVPMTDAEFDHMAKEVRPVVDPDLCMMVERGGEPIGFALTLPDFNRALRHLPNGRLFPLGLLRLLWHKRNIRRLRILTLGFKPGFQHAGLGAAVYLRTWEAGVRKGYLQGEGSWILEDNAEMRRPMERMGGEAYKTYRIYERPLT